VTFQKFKNRRSQNKEVSEGDTKKKVGDEANEIMEIWGSDYTDPEPAAPAEYMPWDSGELSLLKGVPWQGKSAKGTVNQ
jgi:hypothetical protein